MRRHIALTLAWVAACEAVLLALPHLQTDAAATVDMHRDCLTESRYVFTATDALCEDYGASQIGNPYPADDYATPLQASWDACNAYGVVGGDTCAAVFHYGHAYIGTWSIDGYLPTDLDRHYLDLWES